MTEPTASSTIPPGSALKARITDDMKAAMRAREADRLGAIRMLLAAIKQKEVDERIVLDDAQVAAIVDRALPIQEVLSFPARFTEAQPCRPLVEADLGIAQSRAVGGSCGHLHARDGTAIDRGPMRP